MKKTLNQITALSDEVWYHLDIQHPIFLLSIFLCISEVGAKSALGGENPESDIELEAARAHHGTNLLFMGVGRDSTSSFFFFLYQGGDLGTHFPGENPRIAPNAAFVSENT